MTPLYIFDLDGTLALIDHRRPPATRAASTMIRPIPARVAA